MTAVPAAGMLEKALFVAVEAAQAAGQLLRREFHRPGGPHGTSGHAPVDDEAKHSSDNAFWTRFRPGVIAGKRRGTFPALSLSYGSSIRMTERLRT